MVQQIHSAITAAASHNICLFVDVSSIRSAPQQQAAILDPKMVEIQNKMAELGKVHKRRIYGIKDDAPKPTSARFKCTPQEMSIIQGLTYPWVYIIILDKDAKRHHNVSLFIPSTGAIHLKDTFAAWDDFEYAVEAQNGWCSHSFQKYAIMPFRKLSYPRRKPIYGTIGVGRIYVGGLDDDMRRVTEIRVFEAESKPLRRFNWRRYCKECDVN